MGDKSTLRITAVVSFGLLLVPFVFLIGSVIAKGLPDLPNSGDGALLEMSTRDVFSRQILLGPYSRFLFFHPGPLYFVLRYPIYMLFGQRSSSLLIATVLIITVCLFGIWKIVQSKLGYGSSLLLSLVFALFLVVMDKTLWLSEWNPHIIMFPILLFIFSSAAFSAGHSKYIFLCVITGSLVAQSHIAGIPILMGTFLMAGFFLVYPLVIGSSRTIGPSFSWKHILMGFGVLVILWAPPLYEQFTAEKGNMTKIQEFFEENSPDVSNEEVLLFWSKSLTGFELNIFAESIKRSGAGDTVPTIIIAVRLLLLSISFSVLRRMGNHRFLCGLILLVILSHGITYYSVGQVRGELNTYLIEWMGVLAPISWFSIAAAFLVHVRNRFPASLRWLAASGITAAILYISIVVTGDVSGYQRTDLHESWVNELAVKSISDDLAILMDQNPDTFFVLEMHTWDCWAVATGIMNNLEKRGFNIVMADNIWFKPTPVPDGFPARTLHIGYLNQSIEMPPDLIINYDGIGILLE